MKNNSIVNDLRASFLRLSYKLAPFDLKGDLKTDQKTVQKNFISCLICTCNRPNELKVLLGDLFYQTLDKKNFEVVILDNGWKDVWPVIKEFNSKITIKYKKAGSEHKMIGQLRNQTISESLGEYMLLLDDDTRIFQNNFLDTALRIFEEESPDAILPIGEASFGIVKLKYDFLNPVSFGNAAIFYRYETLKELGGFKDELPSYEDIEFSIRLTIADRKVLRTSELIYLHPPFYFDSMQKPLSIGCSIQKLRRHYSLVMWLLIYFNALRFLPYGLVPNIKYQQWFKISLGVLLSTFKKKQYFY